MILSTKAIKGEKYVEELPEEFAAFITDCWNDMQA